MSKSSKTSQSYMVLPPEPGNASSLYVKYTGTAVTALRVLCKCTDTVREDIPLARS